MSAAAQQVHSDTAAGTAVANNLPAGSDGGSCAEASQAEGGGMEDTSSVQQSAPGSAGAAGASRSAALGMLGLMQQMTSTIAAQVATQLQDSLDKAVRQFSTMRSTPEGAADVSDWDGGVGAWLDDSEAALSAEDVGDFLTNEKEVGGKAGEEARDQYLEASRNVVQRGLDSAAVAEGMQAAIGNLAAAAGPTTAAAYCSGELDPGMAAALEQMGSQGSTSAAFCRGKLYTGQGPMPGVSQLLGATVPAEVWEELLENGDKRRLETQTLAARHGTRTAGAPVVPALQENELDLFQAVQASHKLQMVYGGTPKMHAARELDR